MVVGSNVRHEGLSLQTWDPRWIYKLSEVPLHLNTLIHSNQHTNQLLEPHSLSSKFTNNNTRYTNSSDARLFASHHNSKHINSINMVGKNILAAATVCFALASSLAVPKDKLDDKKSTPAIDDHPKTGLPHKVGGPDDKDCSSTAPYPTGDSTNTDFGTGIGIPTGIFPTGSGFVTGVTYSTDDVATATTTDDSALPTITDDSELPTITDGSALTTTDDSLPTATDTVVAKREARPDKGKDTTKVEDNPSKTSDDNGPSATSSPTGIEDNPSRTTDDNGRPTVFPSGVLPSGALNGTFNGTTVNGTFEDNPNRGGNNNSTDTVTLTITESPTVTITITTSTSSSTSKSRQKGKKSKTSSTTTTTSSTSSVDDNPSVTPVA
jgi:hypothetical protein